MKRSALGVFILLIGGFGLAAHGESVFVPIDEDCASLSYSVSGGPSVAIDLAPYGVGVRLNIELKHNGEYVFVLTKKDGSAETYRGSKSGATCTKSESGVSPALLDTRTERTIAGTESETICYSADGWGEGGCGVSVGSSFEGGSTNVLKTATDAGAFEWQPSANGRYRFVHAVEGGETLETAFVVNGLQGREDDPWEIGEGVTAYVKDLVLYLKGEGEVDEFAADAPWAPFDEVLEGAYLSRKVNVPASVAATLPISVEGSGPSGAISGAEFEAVQIIDGKAYLDVSVYTNSEVKAKGEGWGVATNGVIEVPAGGKQGFFYLMSKPAVPSDKGGVPFQPTPRLMSGKW